MNKKGQSILSEHVMIFFVVIGALVVMTTFIQRGFEARIHDAKSFMVSSVNKACDDNCRAATGNKILDEYEPYYAKQISDVQRNEIESKAATSGNAEVLGAVYYKQENSSTKIISTSTQLPPKCAAAGNGSCEQSTSKQLLPM